MKLLLTGAFSYTEFMLNSFSQLGYEVLFHKDEREEIPFDVSDIEAVVCNGLFLYNDISRFSSLKLIQTTSAGLDRIPLDYVKEHNIRLFSARGVYSVPMAEFALAGVLALYKKFDKFYSNRANHVWEKDYSLKEMSLNNTLIVGCGSVGNECAKRFKAMTGSVTGVDIVRPECEYYDRFVPIDGLDSVLGQSDIVILTLPLNDGTRGLFGKEKFLLMRESAVIVNISRGAVIDEEALIKALEEKQLSGAVLDVFEHEPLDSDSKLWDMDNVFITPHNSFYSTENNARLYNLIYENLSAFIKG